MMGIQQVADVADEAGKQQFVRALLRDLQALEYMIEHDWFERDITRIGAEQELFLVDAASMKPAAINQAVLSGMGHPAWLKPELARFNLETNLDPREFTGRCFRDMEAESLDYLQAVRREAAGHGVEVALTGVLPTLNRHDLDMRNLTPSDRYKVLLDATKNQLNDDYYKLHITGIDELVLHHQSSLLPACSNSFQVHLQVTPAQFARYYNCSLVLAAPLLAIAANSPLVFGKRLWHESRMVLYQQASDTRAPVEYLRDRSPRVHFGDHWIDRCVTELYREDISRFKALLGDAADEDSLARVRRGETPRLQALQVHNSTVYRWNRPCYGVSPNGQPHLRIENRLIPAGPTVIDEIANAAFWLGLMVGVAEGQWDVREQIAFSDVQDNFWKAAKHGVGSELTWFGGEKIGARALVGDQLLPIAEKGLRTQGVADEDIERYLGVIAARADTGRTGASWALNSFNRLRRQGSRFEALAAVTADTIDKQWGGTPVHAWEPSERSALAPQGASSLEAEDFMRTRFDTVHPGDPIELAAAIMDWRGIDLLAVDDQADHFLGFITRSSLAAVSGSPDKVVRDGMRGDIPVATPHLDIGQTISLMRQHRLDTLPVVSEGKLVGLVLKADLENFPEPLPMTQGMDSTAVAGISR